MPAGGYTVRNSDIAEAFVIAPGPDGTKGNVARCKRCLLVRSHNVSRMKEHLYECKSYLAWIKKEGISNSITRGLEDIELAKSKQQALFKSGPLDKLIVRTLDPATKYALDKKFALALYTSNRPFNTLDNNHFKSALGEMGYVPPSPKAFAGYLLDEVYADVKSRVEAVIADNGTLSVTTDESSNVAGERISNICFLTKDGRSFHWISTGAGHVRMTGEEISKWLIGQLKVMVRGDFSKITSISTDTCATMRKVWRIWDQSPELQHAFYVPCDSHGLQLLIRDILELPVICDIFKDAQSIVSAFHGAGLQIARHREIQRQVYNKHMALITAGETRWGTQHNMLHSVMRSRNSLTIYANLPGDLISCVDIIRRQGFFMHLEDLISVIRPIHEVQKMSEANKASIAYVFERWTRVHVHLSHIAGASTVVGPVIRQYLDSAAYRDRADKQLSPLHLAAYYLLPEKYNEAITNPSWEQAVDQVLQRYTSDYDSAVQQLYDFKERTGAFHTENPCWKQINKPVLFWRMQKSKANELAVLAERLMCSPANSVASERSFSNMKLQHSVLRNSLHTDRANMLQFIHINTRTLEHMGADDGDVEREEELLRLEDAKIFETAGKRKLEDIPDEL